MFAAGNPCTQLGFFCSYVSMKIYPMATFWECLVMAAELVLVEVGRRAYDPSQPL